MPEQHKHGQAAHSITLLRVDPTQEWLEAIYEFDVRVFGVDAWALRAWKDALSGSWADFVLYIAPRATCEGAEECEGAEAYAITYDPGWDGDPSQWCVVGVGGVSRGQQADILTIGLAEHLRGKGVGDALLAELMTIGTRHGAREFFLEVRAEHSGVQNFYRRHGFEAIAMRKNYYHNDDAVVMHLSLQ